MRRDNLDSRIALANRIGADDLAILPGIMTAFDKAESDPVTKRRRIGYGRDPALTVSRNLIRSAQDSAGVKDFPSVTRKDANQSWPVFSEKLGALTKCTANIGLFV